MKAAREPFFRLAITAIIVYLVINYWNMAAKGLSILLGVATPLFTGFIIAYILNIFMTFFERTFLKKAIFKRFFSIFLSILFVLVLFSLVIVLIVPEISSSAKIIGKGLIALLEQGKNFVELHPELKQFIPEELAFTSETFDWQHLTSQIITFLRSGAMNNVANIVSSVFSGLLNAVLGIIFAIYLLASKERLLNQVDKVCSSYLKPQIKHTLTYVTETANNSFHSFIIGQCTEALILGTLCTIGMLIFRFPYALMIGILIGCTALIPIAGAYIGTAVGAIMILTVSPIQALLFIIFLLVLQQIEGQLIYPRVVGTSIGLPGIWVLASVVVGGGLFGIRGILFGIPLCSTVYTLIKADIHKKEEAKVFSTENTNTDTE